MQTHSITLGMNISDSGKVTNQMWLQFLETEVVTRLDYATITDAIGIYKGNVEKSKIISVTVDERTTGSLSIIENLKQVGQTYKNAIQTRSDPLPKNRGTDSRIRIRQRLRGWDCSPSSFIWIYDPRSG